MVQFLSINFFLGFLQFLLGFSNVHVFLCHPVLQEIFPFTFEVLDDILIYLNILYCLYYTSSSHGTIIL